MRRPGLLAALVLFTLMACTGRSSGPPGSSSAVSGSGSGSGVDAGNGNGNGGDGGQTPPVEGDGKAPAVDPGPGGPACGNKTCAADEQCISYYGVAGPAGPKFQECGIPCQKGGECPAGKKCQTIADGPGPVCR